MSDKGRARRFAAEVMGAAMGEPAEAEVQPAASMAGAVGPVDLDAAWGRYHAACVAADVSTDQPELHASLDDVEPVLSELAELRADVARLTAELAQYLPPTSGATPHPTYDQIAKAWQDTLDQQDEWRRVMTEAAAERDAALAELTNLREKLVVVEWARDRLWEHSVTLNRVGFALAKALGRVAEEGTTSTEADPDELAAAVVRERDAARAESSALRETLQGVTQHLGVVGYERHQLRATVERVRAVVDEVCDGGCEQDDAALCPAGDLAHALRDALRAVDAPPVDAGQRIGPGSVRLTWVPQIGESPLVDAGASKVGTAASVDAGTAVGAVAASLDPQCPSRVAIADGTTIRCQFYAGHTALWPDHGVRAPLDNLGNGEKRAAIQSRVWRSWLDNDEDVLTDETGEAS